MAKPHEITETRAIRWEIPVPRRPVDIARRHHNRLAKRAAKQAIRIHLPDPQRVVIGGSALNGDMVAKFKTQARCNPTKLAALFTDALQRQRKSFRLTRKRKRIT